MSKGDRVTLTADVKWGDLRFKKGTKGTIVKVGSSGYFLKVAGMEEWLYVFRKEVR